MTENSVAKRAVILAGGMGTRLRPITSELPKPLVPIVGVPVIVRLIKKAAQAGVKEAVISAMFMREKLEEKLGNECCGVKLSYVCEPVPLGTAGGAKYAYNEMRKGCNEGNVIILSGDGMWDFDLASAMRYHAENNADVTIVTVRCDSPTEYGTVNTDSDGRICRFAEKPTWSRVVSDRVNTGIYIMKCEMLDRVPDGRKYDFSGDLFPELLEGDRRLFAYYADGYWCDIGDPASYYRCNMEALSGHIRGFDMPCAYTGDDFARAEASYTAPVWVSSRAYIARGANIGAYTVIGDGCCIGEGSVISESIIHADTAVGDGARVNHAIICEGCAVGENAVVGNGAIIGAHSTVGDNAVVADGVTLPPHSKVQSGGAVKSGIGFGKTSPFTITEDGYTFDDVTDLCRMGEALAFAAKRVYVGKNELSGRIGVMCDGKGDKKNCLALDTLLCGIRSAGFKSFNYGEGFETMAAFAATYFLADITVFIKHRTDDKITLCLFDRMGAAVSKDFERALREFFASSNGEKVCVEEKFAYFDTESFTGLRFLYYNELLRMAVRDFSPSKGLLEGVKVGIIGRIDRFSPRHMLYRAVTELGGDIIEIDSDDTALRRTSSQNLIAIYLSDNGSDVSASQNGIYSDKNHIEAMLMAHCSEDIAVPFLSPKAFRTAALGRVLEYLSDMSGAADVNREQMMKSFWVRDGVFAALRLLCVMASEGKSLPLLYNELPRFSIYVRNIEGSSSGKDVRARIMSELAERTDYSHGILREREGIEIVFDNGSVTVIPKKIGGFRLVGEANDAETACELCAAVYDDIEKIALSDSKKSEIVRLG